MNLVQSDCLNDRMNGMNESQYGIQFLLFAQNELIELTF